MKTGGMALEVDVHNLKGIKIGDWVESSYLKGHFKVWQIEHGYRDGKDIGYLLLLKKAMTATMKFSFATEKCHATWCEKLDESKTREIERLLDENLTKKKKFDEMPLLFPCIQELYFLDIEKEQTESFKESLKGLPRYFTKDQFVGFVEQAGWKEYIRSDSPDPKHAVTFSIYTQEPIIF